MKQYYYISTPFFYYVQVNINSVVSSTTPSDYHILVFCSSYLFSHSAHEEYNELFLA